MLTKIDISEDQKTGAKQWIEFHRSTMSTGIIVLTITEVTLKGKDYKGPKTRYSKSIDMMFTKESYDAFINNITLEK